MRYYYLSSALLAPDFAICVVHCPIINIVQSSDKGKWNGNSEFDNPRPPSQISLLFSRPSPASLSGLAWQPACVEEKTQTGPRCCAGTWRPKQLETVLIINRRRSCVVGASGSCCNLSKAGSFDWIFGFLGWSCFGTSKIWSDFFSEKDNLDRPSHFGIRT